MREQNEIPGVYFKFPTQILHIIILPVFLVVFTLLYRPEKLVHFLDMGRDILDFNIIIIGCILLVTLLLTRMLLFMLRKVFHPDYLHYAAWCILEVVVFSLFAALYVDLMYKGGYTYFGVVARLTPAFMGILIWPYLVFGLYLSLQADKGKPAVEAEDKHIRFKDSSQKLKLVIAADSLLYVEAKENYVEICYLDNDALKKYVLRCSMKRLEPLMSAHGMQRCHRTYYINPAHIKVLRKDSKGYILADLDAANCPSIPVSKPYYATLSALL